VQSAAVEGRVVNESPTSEPAYEIIDIVSRSAMPVLILEVRSERIVAASPAARELLEPVARCVVGRSFEEFAADGPTGGIELIVGGRIAGYEAHRVIEKTGESWRFWVRAIDESRPVRFVLVVILPSAAEGPTPIPGRDDDALLPVVGSTDARLIIDGISSDVDCALGYRPQDVIGTSLLAMLDPGDVAAILTALAQTASTGHGVTLRTRVLRADRVRLVCELVLLPLVPPPSCTFALLPDGSAEVGGAGDVNRDGPSVSTLLTRLSRGLRGAAASQVLAALPGRPVAGLARLSSRELDVVSRLLTGDRVPAIAQQLFLSQGTIRNHLSSSFAKLGVSSQQELIALLRPKPVD
jgi:DNA-binding CsgD family transcriptional regulator/PAS domain-containing protein